MNTNPNTKRILCYGDSFTWGYKPLSKHLRIPSNERWTGVLQNLLGDEYEVIEEGLNSRTLTSEDTRSGKEGRRGDAYLIPCLDTHDPLDLVILMLGTNETKHVFNYFAEEIGLILEEKFVKTILNRGSQFRGTTPKLLLIAPPVINETSEYAKERYLGGKEKKDYLSLSITITSSNST